MVNGRLLVLAREHKRTQLPCALGVRTAHNCRRTSPCEGRQHKAHVPGSPSVTMAAQTCKRPAPRLDARDAPREDHERGGSVSNRVKTLLTRFDLDNSGELEMDEFRSCLEDFLAGLQDCEFEALAQRFDSDGWFCINPGVHGRVNKARPGEGGERRLSALEAASVPEDYEYATTASLRSAEDRSFRI